MAMTETVITGTVSVSENLHPQQHSGASSERNKTLRQCVEQSLRDYFVRLEGAEVTDVYNMVLSEVEAPLLEAVMDYVKGNQTRASGLLGLNRGTLRKKLKQYDLL